MPPAPSPPWYRRAPVVIGIVLGAAGIGGIVFGGLQLLDAAATGDEADRLVAERTDLERQQAGLEQQTATAGDESQLLEESAETVRSALGEILQAAEEGVLRYNEVLDAMNRAVATSNTGNVAGGRAIAQGEAARALSALEDAIDDEASALDELQEAWDALGGQSA